MRTIHFLTTRLGLPRPNRKRGFGNPLRASIYVIAVLLVLTACGQRQQGGVQVVTIVASPTGGAVVEVNGATIMPSPTATSTPTSTPTATPVPPIRPLTEGGCCVLPSWSADSQFVQFLDRPAPDAAMGIYSVDITQPSAQPVFTQDLLGIFSPDNRLVAYASGTSTFVERLSDGERWLIPNDGRPVSFSPRATRIIWEVNTGGDDVPFDQRRSDIYLARFDGEDPVLITSLYGGGFTGWIDEQRIAFLGRPSLAVRERTLTVLDTTTNVAADLVAAERIRSIDISPDGTWLAYYITLDPDPERNALWIQRSDGSESRRLDFWGAYQWRDDSHLLYIPTRESPNDSFVVWEYDIDAESVRPVSDPQTAPLHIANGDWRASPDGQYIVYVNSDDLNLWLLELEP